VKMKAIAFQDDSKGANFEEIDIPEEFAAEAQEARDRLLEAVAETDDALMERYLEGDTNFSADDILDVLRRGTLGFKLVPICCGSAFKNKGVQHLMDAVVNFLPSPLDVEAIKGTNPDSNKEETRKASDDAPFSALAFKIINDPFVGQLTFMRVYSGVLQSGTS
ncbi:MAG: elongation factor G, partial [Myxococcales bacterium]|nr:elongation factor G [Myxococcales bacterium]